MVLKQFYLGCLAHASYLIADPASKTALVVDPQRDVDQYLDEAARLGCAVRHVVLTHFHADFVSGHLEIQERTGANVYLGAQGRADYDFIPLKDGDTIDFGSVRLQALETPGHTPESICLLVFDLEKDKVKPHAVLTGDTLFIGDVGRPDLLAAAGVDPKHLGGQLYDSLQKKLLPLPDETLVYPAHGAGSLCGKNLGSETVSTIGDQRRYNYALKPMSRDIFIELVAADQPEAPAYFAYDAALNRSLRPTLDQTLERLKALSPDQVLALQRQGMPVLDVRDPAEFAGAHLADSVNIGLGGKFATWAGTVMERTLPSVLVALPGQEREAATRLGRIGLEAAGYLEGGMAALARRPELVKVSERLTAAQAAERLAGPQPPLILDVRAPAEREALRLKGSIGVPLNHLGRRMEELPKDRPILVHCASGYRSSIAASMLAGQGYRQVSDLIGGIAAWQAERLPVETGA